MEVLKGIDVSKWQKKIDWERVKVDFAIIRAGYCNSDGSIVEDPYYKQNMEGANAAGIPVGVYVYSYAANKAGATKAAKAVLDLVKPYNLQYPLIWDMEDKKYCRPALKDSNTEIVKTVMDIWEANGYYAMWYTYKAFVNSYVDWSKLSKYDFWLAHYTDKTDFKKPFGMWQYSSTGKVDGISGNVDMNYSYKDYASLIMGKGLNRLKKFDVVLDDLTAEQLEQVKTFVAGLGPVKCTVYGGGKF